MAKPKIEGESKEEKFKRIASLRTQRILNDLRLLANCSDKRIYSYNEKDASKIFGTIEKELKRVKSLFSSPKNVFKL
jgi:hypothetical protein